MEVQIIPGLNNYPKRNRLMGYHTEISIVVVAKFLYQNEWIIPCSLYQKYLSCFRGKHIFWVDGFIDMEILLGWGAKHGIVDGGGFKTLRSTAGPQGPSKEPPDARPVKPVDAGVTWDQGIRVGGRAGIV